MSKLVERQEEFSKAMGLLLLFIAYKGYGATLGECWRKPNDPNGHPKSTHKVRLAVDINIFFKGEYLQDSKAKKAHNEIHNFWDMLGGSTRIKNDLNHYSFAYKGVR